jgi:antitoxin component YwqK of YwqJK toxin-antitoxin module
MLNETKFKIYNNESEEEKSFSYYENGNILEEINYKNGLKHGKYIRYYENGKKSEYSNYKNDLLHGTEIKYYPGGNTKTIKGYDKGNSKNFVEYNYLDGEYERKKKLELEKKELNKKKKLEKKNHDDLLKNKKNLDVVDNSVEFGY